MSTGIGRVTEAQVRRELIRTDRKASHRRGRIGAAVVLAAALIVGTLVTRFLFTLVDMRTSGMGDALRSGDVVLCARVETPLWSLELHRGSLALVRYSENGMQRLTVRRVIAQAGDEVSVESDGRVSVNGEILEEPYARYRSQVDWGGGETQIGGALGNPFSSTYVAPTPSTEDTELEGVEDVEFPLIVPEGSLFVLCDDRENALDSRSSRFGLVKEADVQGVARLVIWPVHRAGMLAVD